MSQKKLPKLKPQEAKFVVKYIENNFNGTQTVREVYGIQDDKYASVKAVRLIGKDSVAQAIEAKRETLKSALENQGVTPEKIAEKVDELLDATRQIYKNNNATKQIELVGEEPDYQAIDKGLKHAKDIYGIEDLDDKPKNNTTYNFIFNQETQQEVRKIEEVIKAQLIKGNDSKTEKTV